MKAQRKKMTKVSVESNKNAVENQHDLDAMEEMLGSDSDEKSVTEESDHEIDDEESSSADGEESDEGVDGKPLTIATETHGEEICTFDVRNLVAINSHQINSSALYKKKLRGDDDIETTINTKGMSLANEKHLLQKASDGCTQLLSKLWKLDTERTDAGLLAALPSYFEIVTPRELPPPIQAAETKWEKFAKERGIAPKEKRSRKVWDEATNEWAYRTGYQKASKDNPESWPIMEVKGGDDPYEDPWEKARDAKKDRLEKNSLNRLRNAERSQLVEKGTARRTIKAQKKAREMGREGGKLDTFTHTPAGLPIDMEKKQRGKALTKAALLATQRSTASMGKFDKMREGEPERKKAMSGMKKRKFESGTSENVVKSEAKRSIKVLNNVLNGSDRSKDKAIRRGDFSKGETAYDYDYNDGLGSSTYKKKKGRAGIGKMKKITKKLAK